MVTLHGNRAVHANRWTRLDVGEQLLEMIKKEKEKKLINALYFLAFPVILNSCFQKRKNNYD
jgi:hypothetical protein